MFRIEPVKLHDCAVHGRGSGAELFVVEGDSASKSVCRARDPRMQAVMPMQGKPLNALKASRRQIDKYGLYRELEYAIGAGADDDFELSDMRYDRVIVLCDADADGIHCGALLLMYFYRWMRPMLDSNRLFIIRPPLYEIVSPRGDDRLHAYSDWHYEQIRKQLDAKQIEYRSQRYRGLAGMNEDTLVSTCLNADTRNITPLTCEDAEAAIRVFVG